MTYNPYLFIIDSGIFPINTFVFFDHNNNNNISKIKEQLFQNLPVSESYINEYVMNAVNWNFATSVAMTEDNVKCNLLYFPKLPQSITELTIIGHEVNHLTFNIFEQLGIKKLNSANMEVFAYLEEHLMKQIYNKLGLTFNINIK